MSDVGDLTAWLTQIWDQDEARLTYPTFRQILALHQPDRPVESWYWLERECAECHHRWHKWVPDKRPTDIGPEQGCPTVRLLALPYADRPGYREEWRP